MKNFSKRLWQVVFYGCLALVAIWWFGLEGASPRQLFSPAAVSVPFPESLLQLVSIDVEQRPLDEVLRELSAQHKVLIQFDPAVFQSGSTQKVSLKVERIPLYGALTLLVRSINTDDGTLVVRVKEGVAYVTNKTFWYSTPSNFVTRVYPLDSVLSAPSMLRESDLGDVIAAKIQSESWGNNVKGALGAWEPIPGGLVIVQTPDVHDQISRLIAHLRHRSREDHFIPIEIRDPCHVANSVLRKKLQKRVDVVFEKTKLSEVLTELGRKHELPIVLDPDTTQGKHLKQPECTFRLRDVTLATVLDLICSDTSCSHAVKCGAVIVRKENRSPYRYASSVPWTHTMVQSLVDLHSWLDGDLVPLAGLFDKVRGDQGILLEDQFVATGSSDSIQHLALGVEKIRQAAFPYRIESISTNSAQHEALTKPVTWGGMESVRSLANRLSNELKTNVWVDADSLSDMEQIGVDHLRKWPDATASVRDFFRRPDMRISFAVEAWDEAIVLTGPQRAEARKILSVHGLGHWLGNNHDSELRWEAIEKMTPDVPRGAIHRLRDTVTVMDDANNFIYLDSVLRAMSHTRWPPKGIVDTWNDAVSPAVFCAFDVGPIVKEFQSVSASRLATSPQWPFAALLFAETKNRPRALDPQGKSAICQRLESTFDSVVSLTIHNNTGLALKTGVSFKILDHTALAVIGPDDPPRVQSMLDALARQAQKPAGSAVEALRLDTWNVEAPPGQTTAFLYDVRSLVIYPEIDEDRLRQIVEKVTPPSIVKRYQYSAADIEILPGFLLVIHDLKIQRSLAKLFNYLRSDAVQEFTRIDFGDGQVPPSKAEELARCVKTLLRDLQVDDDQVCNNFRVWQLGQLNGWALEQVRADPEITAALVEHMERTITADDALGCYMTVMTLNRINPRGREMLSALNYAVTRKWESNNRVSLIELLSRMNPWSTQPFMDLLVDDDLLVQAAAREALMRIEADVVVPDLLAWLDRTRRNEAFLVLNAVDPSRNTTSSRLEIWEWSEEPELQARAKRLRQLFQEQGFELK